MDTSQPGGDSSLSDSGPLIGQYQLLGTLGKGGMGEVFRARHIRLKREVAIKFLHGLAAISDRRKQRFYQEMEALGRLDHPHVVRATDAGEWQGCPYLVMELLSGADLYQYVVDMGPLTVPQACEAIRQAALGLQYAHEMKLVHRDIKPSNLFLTRSGIVKVLDMGLVRLQDQDSDDNLTSSQEVMGTADYMAPEQADNCREVDIRADLYSLGCSLYFLLTGQPPYPRPRFSSWKEKVQAHASEPPPSLVAHCSDAPLELEAILQKLLAKKPEDRYETPREVAEALLPLTGQVDLSVLGPATQSFVLAGARATESGSPQTKEATGPKRKGPAWRILAAGGLFGLCALTLGYLYFNREKMPEVRLATPSPSVELVTAPPVSPTFQEAGKWHDLLEGRPLVLWEPKFNFRWSADPVKKDLWFDSNEKCMIQLGETAALDYEVEIIFQTNAVGPMAGIFLGYQKDTKDPLGVHLVQVELARTRPTKGAAETYLDCVTVRMRTEPPHNLTRNQVDREMLGAEPLYRFTLAVKVQRGQLSEVALNGKLLPDWPERLNTRFAASMHGKFGIVGANGSATVVSARYRWHRLEE